MPDQPEAFSRIFIDKALKESGWNLLDPQQVRYELHGRDGRSDYVLLNGRGSPLCVLEAKKPDIDPYEAEEQAQDAIIRAKQLQDLRDTWRRQLQTPRASGLAPAVVDCLFENPLISANEVQRRFKVSHPTAMQTIRRLEQLKILKEITGKDRHRLYLAEKIMSILE